MEKVYKSEVLQTAKNDIEDILYYVSYKLNNKMAAKHLKDDFKKSINDILTFLYGLAIYRVNKTLKIEYRKVLVKNYVMFYVINEKNNTITIVRVIFNRMNFNTHLK